MKKIIPASPIQKQFWMHQQNNLVSPAYTITSLFRISGNLDSEALLRSIQLLVDSYENLRTTFKTEGAELYQVIASDMVVEMSQVLICKTVLEDDESLRMFIKRYVETPFDLEAGPLIRCMLFCSGNNAYAFLMVLHHCICDLRTKDILAEKLSNAYESYLHGSDAELIKTYQYSEFSESYIQWFQSSSEQKAITYWSRHLKGADTFLSLPLDKNRPKVQRLNGTGLHGLLGKNVSEAIHTYAKDHVSDRFLVLLSAYYFLMHILSHQSSIIIGIPLSNRRKKEYGNIVGCCVNIVPIHINFKEIQSFDVLVKTVRIAMLGAHRNQELPLAHLLHALPVKRTMEYNALFQVGFTFEHPMDIRLNDLTVDSVYCHHGGSQLDLFATFWEGDKKRIAYVFEYNSDIFTEETIAGFKELYTRILSTVTGTAISDLNEIINAIGIEDFVPKGGKELLKARASVSERNEYPHFTCLHTLFEHIVVSQPDMPAIWYNEYAITYNKLNDQANCVAWILIHKGVQVEDIVGICIDRSFEMVIGLMAILKAGGAYLPIDPEYPEERIGFMMEDAHCPCVLTEKKYETYFASNGAQVLCLDDEQLFIGTKKINPECAVTENNLAYVIYTSGSTGQPKGVMVEHKAIANRLLWMQKLLTLNPNDRILQKTTYCFDVSVWEFFLPLITGAQLVIAKPGGHKDNVYLLKEIIHKKITLIHFVPSMLRYFLENEGLEKIEALKTVVCSGETLFVDLVKAFYEKIDAELYNFYGPTEAAVDVSYWKCPRDGNLTTVPIGVAIDNIELHIFNEAMEIVHGDREGELYIGGIGLARGYVNRDKLTRESFVSNPFDASGCSRLYKTGDVCRYLSDGTIEHIGRNDFQVKIRGQRIELEEIETAIRTVTSIKECAVISEKDRYGDVSLVAYCIAYNAAVDTKMLKQQLRVMLPEYMIPNAYVFLDTFPYTSSGKLDRKALKRPKGEILQEYTGGRSRKHSHFENILLKVWCEVLDVPDFDSTVNLFDGGGTSFHIIRFVNELKRRNNITIDVLTVYEYASIQKLTAFLEKN